ncbi:MAG: DUF465 domain-containing protein [Pseudomonadota bacterium]
MSIQGRIEELSTRHRKLDEQISLEQRRPAVDTLDVRRLKREKLKIKEELQQLKAS